MDFLTYISTPQTITIPVMIRANSTILMADAYRICVALVDAVAAENPDLHAWLELTDVRDSKQYTVFSQAMMDRYTIRQQVNPALDMVAIRQAIVQSSPAVIRTVIADELAKLLPALSPQAVAEVLKAGSEFLATIQPRTIKQIGVVILKQQVALSVQRAQVVLRVTRRVVDLQVRVSHATE